MQKIFHFQRTFSQFEAVASPDKYKFEAIQSQFLVR